VLLEATIALVFFSLRDYLVRFRKDESGVKRLSAVSLNFSVMSRVVCAAGMSKSAPISLNDRQLRCDESSRPPVGLALIEEAARDILWLSRAFFFNREILKIVFDARTFYRDILLVKFVLLYREIFVAFDDRTFYRNILFVKFVLLYRDSFFLKRFLINIKRRFLILFFLKDLTKSPQRFLINIKRFLILFLKDLTMSPAFV
jgi:hypothetical protein